MVSFSFRSESNSLERPVTEDETGCSCTNRPLEALTTRGGRASVLMRRGVRGRGLRQHPTCSSRQLVCSRHRVRVVCKPGPTDFNNFLVLSLEGFAAYF